MTESNDRSEATLRDDLDGRALHAVLDKLQEAELLPMRTHGDVYLAADYLIQAGGTMYLIKPRVNRLWRRNQAIQDVRQIVESVQGLTEE